MEPSHEYVPGIPRGVSDRHCHSGSGYGYHHPKHAFSAVAAAECSRPLGIASGQTIWAFATSLGIVALLVASAPLFLAVKYVGAAYLVYLGIQALREAARPTAPEPLILPDVKRRLSRWAAFRQGLVSDLGNPKMAIFFASLLPQFVSPGGASVAAFTLLGIVFAGMTFSWLVLYAVVLANAGMVCDCRLFAAPSKP